MDFTNDIKFSRKPTSNELLRISYYGHLAKENSNDLTLVYGFGENWDNTTEQKMEKTVGGFTTKIKVLDSSTLNFCFRNEYNVWDNNNSFNYISEIKPQKVQNTSKANTNTTVEKVEEIAEQPKEKIIEPEVYNELQNYSELNFNTVEEPKVNNIEDADILDSLLQELFAEYENQNNASTTQIEVQTTQENTPSLSNIESESLEDTYTEFFADIEETAEPTKYEYYEEVSNLFDELIEQIRVNEETTQEIATTEQNELNETISQIVENISIVEEKSDVDVNSLNFDYSDFNEMFAFAQNLNKEEEKIEENIFNFDDSTFDFSGLIQNIVEEKEEESVFNFSDAQFDFSNLKTTTPAQEVNEVAEITTNKELFNFEKYLTNSNAVLSVSDSFYDDEDTTTHTNYYNIQSIADTAIDELNQEAFETSFDTSKETADSEYKFEQAINEYANYFDSLINEIVAPTQEIEETAQETTIESVQVANNQPVQYSNERVADEYALFDYQNHSSAYLFTRRVKMIVSTLFTKLPKLFGKEGNTENN